MLEHSMKQNDWRIVFTYLGHSIDNRASSVESVSRSTRMGRNHKHSQGRMLSCDVFLYSVKAHEIIITSYG